MTVMAPATCRRFIPSSMNERLLWLGLRHALELSTRVRIIELSEATEQLRLRDFFNRSQIHPGYCDLCPVGVRFPHCLIAGDPYFLCFARREAFQNRSLVAAKLPRMTGVRGLLQRSSRLGPCLMPLPCSRR